MSNKTFPELATDILIAAIPAMAEKHRQQCRPEEFAEELGQAFKVIYRHVQEAYHTKDN
ncbi:MAG: hypothetical protein Q4B94_04530 [Pseudomonadota bacterium]|nr:hypothetical protein [Pseudomonadota bacterium]